MGRTSHWGAVRVDGLTRGLIVVVLFASTLYFGMQKQPTEMGIMAAMGLVLLAFTNLDRFTSFKGAGFEAQMRDMQQATKEAQATLAQLQKMSKTTAEIMTQVVAQQGRFGGGFEPEQAADYREKMTEALVAMDIDKAQASAITARMTMYGTMDLLNELDQYISGSLRREKLGSLTDWHKVANGSNASPEHLRAALAELEINDPQANELIDRLEAYQKRMVATYGTYPPANPQ